MTHGGVLTAHEVTVRVNGASVATDSVRVRSEILSDVEMFTGGNGLAEAEADITWALPSGLATTSEHPWLPSWDKQPGTPIEIDVDGLDGGTTTRVFTGTITQTRVDMDSGVVTSRCVGHEARLARQVSVPAVSWVMYPIGTFGTLRYPGMFATWPTGHVLAQCDFWPHQPWQPTRMVAASMMGSGWPETGDLRVAYSNTRGANLPPVPARTSWGGVGLEDPYLIYDGVHSGAASDPWTLTVDLGDPAIGDEIYVEARAASDDGFRLVITQTQVKVQRFAVFAEMAWVDVPGLVLTRAGASTRATVQYVGGNLEMALDAMAAGEFQPAPVAATLNMGYTAGSVTVDAQSGVVGAVQLYRSAVTVTTEPRTAVFRRDVSTTTIGVTDYETGDGLSLLVRQSREERIPMWVDAHGVFQCADRASVDNGPTRHVWADAPDLLRELWSLPANRFGNPLPESTVGFTAATSTGMAVLQGPSLPYLLVENLSSSASTMARYVEYLVPVTPGAVESWSVQARSPDGETYATISVQFGGPGSAATLGEATNSTTWEDIAVTAEVPQGASQARIRVGNGSTLTFGGVLHFRGFTTLGPAAALEALSASTSTRAVYGRVVVKGREAKTHVYRYPRYTVWEIGGSNYENGDPIEAEITPERDTSWLVGSIHTDAVLMGSPGSDGESANAGWYSWLGGYQQSISNPDASGGWITDTHWTGGFVQVAPDKVLLQAVVDNLAPDYRFAPYPHPTSVGISAVRKTHPATVLRSYGIVKWTDAETVVDLPTQGPDYVIDMGTYGQSPERRQAVADEAAAFLADPPPVLDGLRVEPAAVSLGDRSVVHLRHVAGLTVDAVTILRDLEFSADTANLGVDVRVLGADVTSLTLPQIPDIDEFLAS